MRKVLILRRIEMQNVCNFYTENQDIFTTDEYAKSVFTQIINNNAIISKLIIENDASTKPITKKNREIAFKKKLVFP